MNTRNLLKAFSLALWTLSGLAGAALAQEGEVPDGVQVPLVDVEVGVNDRQGLPVIGLGEDDFKLLVDGNPVEIRHFSAAAPPQASPQQAAEAPEAAAPLYLAVLVDRSYMSIAETRDLEDGLQSLLDSLGPRDRAMLVTADRGLQVVRPLGPPPVDVAPLFAGEAPAGRGQQILSAYNDLLRQIERTLSSGQSGQARGGDQVPAARFLVSTIDQFTTQANADVEVTARQLKILSRAIAGLPGRRAVVYVSGRLPIMAGQSLIDAWRGAYDPAFNELLASNEDPTSVVAADAQSVVDLNRVPMPEVVDSGTQQIADAASQAAAVGVAFYTLDGVGQRSRAPRALTEGSSSLDSQSGRSYDYDKTQRAANLQVLQNLAERTGGRTAGNRRDLSELAAGLFSDTSSHYSLGFYPPQYDGDLHEIEVRLQGQRKKLQLRHRRYFRSRPADLEAAGRTISALLLAQAPESLPNPLEVAVEVGTPRPGEGDRRVLPLTVQVPVGGLALLADTWAHRAQISVFYTAGSLETGSEPVRRSIVPVRIANEDILNAFGRRAEYALEMEADASARALAVTVRDDFDPRMSTVVVPLSKDEEASEADSKP